MLLLPVTSSFAVLVTARLLQILALGAFCTADASLIVYLIGPEKSRPFTMAFHALIGAGFLAATFLVRPFLPSSEMDTEDICGGGGRAAQDNITSMSAAADVENTTAAATAEEGEGIQSIA